MCWVKTFPEGTREAWEKPVLYDGGNISNVTETNIIDIKKCICESYSSPIVFNLY